MITLDKLLNMNKSKDKKSLELISKSYYLAEKYHEGQYRDSGEEYIIHPLTVACILSEFGANTNTICAALLHDTLEDTEITEDIIRDEINSDVLSIVKGVTKKKKKYFSTKEDQNNFNTRKLISSIPDDPRIILLKLADRLHNMSTLEFKSREKQMENANETMELFVPLARLLGVSILEERLSDLSFKYLNPELYKEIEKLRDDYVGSYSYFDEDSIREYLNIIGVRGKVNTKFSSVYSIYKDMVQGRDISYSDIEIVVDDDDKDRVNIGYKVISFEEEKKKNLGLAYYFHRSMNKQIRNRYMFSSVIDEINGSNLNDKDYLDVIKRKVLCRR